MNAQYLKRLFSALLISSGCFGATVYWYHSGAVHVDGNGDKQPIAQLAGHINDVQRKPLARVIWESISQDEPLYAGEAIRTTNVSEAKILFVKTGTMIELEPDSLVVLEENEDGIALDFLKGNLFVKSGKGTAKSGSLKLKSGGKSLDLSNASASLSKTKKGNLDLEVFAGQAQLTSNGKTVNLNKDASGILSDSGLQQSKNHIKILTPKPGEPIFIDIKKDRTVTYQWNKLAKGYKVFIERGRKRSQLTRNESVQAKGTDGKLTIRQKVGKFYWRLVAVPSKPGLPELTSKTISGQVIAKAPPVLLEPEQDAKIVLKKTDPQLQIKWATKVKLESLVVEIAKDAQLKQKISQEYLDDNVNFMNIKMPNTGVYFWRITGFMKIKGKMEPVSSEVRKFDLKIGVDLVPPTLKSPLAKQHLNFEQVSSKGLYVSWNNVPGIEKYNVQIKKVGSKDKPFSRVVATSPLRFDDFTPGKYQWQVSSLDKEGKTSKPSEKRQFVVDEMPRIDWADGSEPSEHLYFTAKPELAASWKQGAGKAVSWRYRYARPGELTDQVKWKKTAKPYLKASVKRDGEFEVVVEALNEKGLPIARSSNKIVTIKEKPLLPAPEFAKSLPTILKSNRRGLLKLSWDGVNGASKYKVEVVSKDGKVVREATVSRNLASLKRLKPGEYKVTIKSIDQHQRMGPANTGRDLTVPKLSNIKAPKLNKIEVK